MAGDDEKTWLLYAETASSLTRLYQHGAQQKRDAYNAGYKAALESVLQFAVKECSDGQTNTVAAATLINFILPQMQREAAGAAEREGRAAASAPAPTSPFAPHAPHGAQARAAAVGVGDAGLAMPAACASAAFLGAPAHFAAQDSGHACTAPSQPAWPAPPHAAAAAYDAADGGARQPSGGFCFAPPRKRNADATDWMDGGYADGALQPFGQLPPDWPVWSKRGRH
jgi:hypothetical protein